VRSAGKSLFVLLVLAAFLISCSRHASELPDYGTVPAFRMTASTGEPFDGSSLVDKVWVADFIYTNCPAECPMMTSRMHSLEKRVRGHDDVRLVSISVDPERDTPAALTAFAHRYGAPTEHWIFLTGSATTVHELAYTTFHLGDVLGKISHSTKFVLVDKRGHLRGYYSSFDQEGIPTLLKDLEALRQEPA
jgi:protein SCO1/2